MFKQQLLPDTLMKTAVVPVSKNKSLANYSPISLGTVIGKFIERLVQPVLAKRLTFNDAQFGFRRGLN